jgi:hypothetical protein
LSKEALFEEALIVIIIIVKYIQELDQNYDEMLTLQTMLLQACRENAEMC